ncbi:MAG: hypothetical protein DRG24_05890 [Epsilonproteobacteria bacterium]|nr:MAG: hypothetical protein DRG24_05890 [Campylobacterota bacterium]
MKFFTYAPLLFFMLVSSVYSVETHLKQLLSPEETLKVIETIKERAIVFGEGDKEIHTFIDPYCSMSQRYLNFVFKKKSVMFKKYKIYLYLYELPRKKSKEMIKTIISSEYKEIVLKQVMINNEKIELDDDGDAEEIMEEISEAAEKIGVYKRPYILINGKAK